MAGMGGRDLENHRRKLALLKPRGDLVAQRAEPNRDRSAIVAILALARDDKHQSQPARMRPSDKSNKCRMGLRKCHAVKIKPRLWGAFSPLELLERLPVHLKGRCIELLAERRQRLVHGAACAGPRSDPERRRLEYRALFDRAERRRLAFRLLGGWLGFFSERIDRLGCLLPKSLVVIRQTAFPGHPSPRSPTPMPVQLA